VVGARREAVKLSTDQRILKPLAGLLQLFGIKHITKRSDTVLKAFISVCNYIVVRVLFGVPLSDYQNIAFYPTSFIQSMTIESQSSFGSPELLIKAYAQGFTFKEVPISFIPRQMGQAKGTKLKSICQSISDIARFWFKWNVLRRRTGSRRGHVKRLSIEDWH
jgi:hypothetical protein